jgi:hypothetical protein
MQSKLEFNDFLILGQSAVNYMAMSDAYKDNKSFFISNERVNFIIQGV